MTVGNMTPEKARELFKPGTKLKLNKAYNGYKKGDKVTVKSVNYGNPVYIYTEEGGSTRVLTPYYVELIPLTIEELNEQVEGIKEEKKVLDAEISEIKAKISFMKANKIKEFDEKQFKVFKTLETLEDPNMSQLEKAKIIAGMIN